MKTTIEAYDHNLHTTIFTAEIDFEPDILIVNSVESSNPVWDKESVRLFLYDRAYEMSPKSYEDDLPALEKLDHASPQGRAWKLQSNFRRNYVSSWDEESKDSLKPEKNRRFF